MGQAWVTRKVGLTHRMPLTSQRRTKEWTQSNKMDLFASIKYTDMRYPKSWSSQPYRSFLRSPHLGRIENPWRSYQPSGKNRGRCRSVRTKNITINTNPVSEQLQGFRWIIVQIFLDCCADADELLVQKELLVPRTSRQLLGSSCRLSLWPRESVERECFIANTLFFASMVENSRVRLVHVRSRRHDERTM